MSQSFNYENNEYVSSSNGQTFSASSGANSGAGYAANSTGAASYEVYGVSASNNGASVSAGEASGGDLVYSSGNASGSATASDLLLLSNARAANYNNNSVVRSSGSSYLYENGAVGSSVVANADLSSLEVAILRSSVPVEINETEEITVNGQRGIWANKAETLNWRGAVPINEYAINEDPNPEVVTKRSQQQVVYSQEVAIRYLRPPTPPAPGEIFIQQESNIVTPPAPPLIIRQQPPRPVTPQPLVVREAPPQPPAAVGRKVITISGKRLPPPPRKVVIERLAPLPSKPQSVIIERWLPYSQVKRRVMFQKANDREVTVVKPKNVIIQWEAPQVLVKKEFKDLGIIRANPSEYVARYGATLKAARELPSFVLEIKPPAGVVLAADYQQSSIYELEGDLQALRLIDLDREGLSEYRSQLQRLSILSSATNGATSSSSYNESYTISNANVSNLAITSGSSSSNIIGEIFSTIDRDSNGKISVEEAEKILLRLNSRLGRRYGEDDVKAFFNRLDSNRDGQIDLAEFRQAFERTL